MLVNVMTMSLIDKKIKLSWTAATITLLVVTLVFSTGVMARDVEHQEGSGEIVVYVNPGEPTQVQFPSDISGGYKKKDSTLMLDRKNRDLIVFANQGINDIGEAFIVRLEDGRSYSLRAKRATDQSPRDDFVSVMDQRGSIILSKEEEEPAYKEKNYKYAPPSVVSGLVREMVLAAEFGKAGVAGYQRTEKYKGQVVLNDGTMLATIDSIFVGPSLWGYVIDAKNLLDTTQQINPATFRLDGTRAVSATNWELAPKPLSVEQQIASKDKTKIYIVTKAR